MMRNLIADHVLGTRADWRAMTARAPAPR